MEMMQIEAGQAMTVREAAAALGLRSQSIYNLLRDELLRGEKTPDGIWLLDRESVNRYAMRQKLRRVSPRTVLRRGAIDVTASAHAAIA